MTNTAPASQPTMTPRSDAHAVFAYTADGERHRVSAENMDYGTALEMWQRIDGHLQGTTEPARINGSQIQWFNVRSMDDPNWNGAPKGAMVWGYVLADYGVDNYFTVTVDLEAKKLSEAQAQALYGAARKFAQGCDDVSLHYDLHGRTKKSLVERGLARSQYGPALTQLGLAVAHAIYIQRAGETVEQGRARYANDRRARKIKTAIAKDNRRRRIQNVLSRMPTCPESVRQSLLRESYGSPMQSEDGTVRLTLAELEAMLSA